ncbi:hypothetical protein LO772_10950 [Yinghuangia sp. ASG 101]|uniref:hypothetical protein n=1 Tax=Yinghuangia sp. ASG 101 TaxID=2896848 RepID=UPI001E3E0A67|nr:hypothetical protein [Yinghuangia sp. ASG 101]UGQ14069.1 hypothetical protein LO772_10950 [Yinghuangia sp. ASG 101]
MTETVHRIPLRAPLRKPAGAVVLVGEWRQHHPAHARGWVRAYSFVLTGSAEDRRPWSIRFRLPEVVGARVNPLQTFTRFDVVRDGPEHFAITARPGHIPPPGGTLAVDLQLLHETREFAGDPGLLDLTFG